MSTPHDDGGPAFPHLNPNYDGNLDKEPQRGCMNLRDWFAGHAIYTAWRDLARCEDEDCGTTVGGKKLNPSNDVYTFEKFVSIRAYEYADAMLAARKESKP